MQGKLKTFKTDSQCANILAHLQKGNTLTCLECALKGWGMNLRSRISNLRDAGHNVVSEKLKVNGTYVARYKLEV